MIKFSGEGESKLDAKGRLVLPTRFKKALPEGQPNKLVLIRGIEKCLVVYPEAVWDNIFKKLEKLTEFNEAHRKLQRNIFRGFTEFELDNLGRFTIPKTMQQYAELDGTVLVVGLVNRLEIWNPQLYEEALAADSAQMSEMAERILGNDAGFANLDLSQ